MSRGNVLIDDHQADLAESLHRLFEDRLGFTVYVPTGHSWWDEGYWQFGAVFGDDRLAQQYLMSMDETGGGFHPRKLRLITVEQFREIGDWKIICASVQENQHGYARLAQEVGAKYVYQVGNTGQQIDWSLDPLVLSSSEMPILGRGIQIHQELDIEGVFGFSPYVGDRRTVASFVNLFPGLSCFPYFEEVRALMPDWRFSVYGHESAGHEKPVAFVKPITAQAEVMRANAFAWNDKVHGDGFGHVIHAWAALGRPLIGHSAHYRGKMAELFWEDGVTSIDLDHRTPREVADVLRELARNNEWYASMCRAIRAKVDNTIDYAAEAAAIDTILELP